MIRVPSPEEWKRRHSEGMRRTPAMPCKRCGKKTRAWWGKGQCQYCGEYLSYDEGVALARRPGLW